MHINSTYDQKSSTVLKERIGCRFSAQSRPLIFLKYHIVQEFCKGCFTNADSNNNFELSLVSFFSSMIDRFAFPTELLLFGKF